MLDDKLLNNRFDWGFGFSPTGLTSVLAYWLNWHVIVALWGPRTLGLPQVSCLFACLSGALRAERPLPDSSFYFLRDLGHVGLGEQIPACRRLPPA